MLEMVCPTKNSAVIYVALIVSSFSRTLLHEVSMEVRRLSLWIGTLCRHVCDGAGKQRSQRNFSAGHLRVSKHMDLRRADSTARNHKVVIVTHPPRGFDDLFFVIANYFYPLEVHAQCEAKFG